ncbi:hypothetical protein BKA62DRAFT_824902 [Auriculariales sp. MPI-PUGE-AT-0066]|nr:hypothetical protein BKA62DRAFT_824902 [Auriculariales sp. MPI-PUGE-AT-0066]
MDATMTDISPSSSSWARAAISVSPRRATLRSAAKRPRSPSPLGSPQVAHKRQMYSKGQFRSVSLVDSSSADWVTSTRQLSIRSHDEPINAAQSSFPRMQSLSRSSSAMDEDDMMTDSPPRPIKSSASAAFNDIPRLALYIPNQPQTASAGKPVTPFTYSLDQNHLQLPEFAASIFGTSQSHGSVSMPHPCASLMVPRINVQPATPDSISRGTSMAPPSPLVPLSPLNQAWPSSPSSVSTPNSKKRITMGPRADCEKCRVGVKGHWMHFD